MAWLVTGTIARDAIDAIIQKHPLVGVLVAPVSVASFITAAHVARLVAERPWIGDAPVIVPGTVKWDAPPGDRPPFIVKGPRGMEDLEGMLANVSRAVARDPGISGRDLAGVIASFQRAKDDSVARVAGIIGERREILASLASGVSASQVTPKHPENERVLPSLGARGRNFTIPGTSLVVGRDFPPVLVAEIVNAPEKAFDQVEAEARYFVSSGADIIDVGGTPGRVQAAELGEIVGRLARDVGVPTSIDSMVEPEILAGVENGARVVLSIDHGNIGLLDTLPRDLVLVLIPTNTRAGIIPATPKDRVHALDALVDAARERGFERLLVDPILNSPINPGTMVSLEALALLSPARADRDGRDIPVFIGGSNVSEMIDTDSTGVNALLAVLGVELGAGMLFTTEDSAKCLGSVKEMRRGRDLAFLASMLGTCPKDLGISAINVKRKERFVPSFTFDERDLQVIQSPRDGTPYATDASGLHVKIMVEHRKDRITLGVFDKNGLARAWSGTSAEALGKDVVGAFDLSPSHVLYIGRELARAEHCLQHDVIYVQDE